MQIRSWTFLLLASLTHRAQGFSRSAHVITRGRSRGTTPRPVQTHVKKWASDTINEFSERIESLKAAVVGGISGSVAMAPVSLVVHPFNIAQWEFNTDQAALQCALFAVVYRYVVRTDENPMLKQGAVGAFILTRTLGMVRTSDMCEAIPLRCGPPLSYLDWNMLGQILGGGLESVAAFGATAVAVEWCTERKFLRRFGAGD